MMSSSWTGLVHQSPPYTVSACTVWLLMIAKPGVMLLSLLVPLQAGTVASFGKVQGS